MVKENWSMKNEQVSTSSISDSNSSNACNSYNTASSLSNSNQQQQQPKTAADLSNVWGVYESKEKLIEMHIC